VTRSGRADLHSNLDVHAALPAEALQAPANALGLIADERPGDPLPVLLANPPENIVRGAGCALSGAYLDRAHLGRRRHRLHPPAAARNERRHHQGRATSLQTGHETIVNLGGPGARQDESRVPACSTTTVFRISNFLAPLKPPGG